MANAGVSVILRLPVTSDGVSADIGVSVAVRVLAVVWSQPQAAVDIAVAAPALCLI